MNIVFFCQSCGARFEVPPASAGKKGRCKSCGQMMTVPQAQELASMVAMPALAAAASGPARHAGRGRGRVGRGRGRGQAAAEAGAETSLAWLAAASSNVALAPLTIDEPAGSAGAAEADQTEVSTTTSATPSPTPWPSRCPRAGGHVPRGGRAAPKMLWRKELGGVQRLFRMAQRDGLPGLRAVPDVILLGAIVRAGRWRCSGRRPWSS